ncbi:MAG: thylakoid membrane photosystem I accumulation factor [Trichodesmium sp. St15_bin1_1]|jgi:thiol-disulfide isomerase/thioredoxin|nr:thylakoid membrane photosystem I accumulation factor [Trichodesmium sp. MAG_R02]MDE5079886.1 thylakoid membrane photosystem I accumulation factor [Trichodesmium sp. St18_bin1]MDE5086408.1 thylakoid membrane photosystem I accumulation factor [Trichodesmium sp. St16_bin2-tuft]MDE5106137.1 thylakoid membrane photosystem I accumulation factor [Trichodesmium sp. St17_bin3_1_1]MDE5111091.1 thylakoid membrane photosystem I accumulation factor [Trichodesmium sp. St7_bin2_1]MDE5112986.1 thylakoid me
MLNLTQRFSWSKIFLSSFSFLLAIFFLLLIATPTALASLNDDKFDGNIFALYAGNGSLVPARITLQDSLKNSKPTLLVFFLDDSKDCKQFSTVVSQLQEFYGRAADFIPVNVDAMINPVTDDSTKVAYYYQGFVPQTVLINQQGEVVINEKGQVPFEKIDDVFREVFDLLPRSESAELKRRIVNEINVELRQ